MTVLLRPSSEARDPDYDHQQPSHIQKGKVFLPFAIKTSGQCDYLTEIKYL